MTVTALPAVITIDSNAVTPTANPSDAYRPNPYRPKHHQCGCQCGLCSSFCMQSELHVTLWHRDHQVVPEAAAAAAELVQQRDALLAVAGHEVQLQLVALDISPEVTAAHVCTTVPPAVLAHCGSGNLY